MSAVELTGFEETPFASLCFASDALAVAAELEATGGERDGGAEQGLLRSPTGIVTGTGGATPPVVDLGAAPRDACLLDARGIPLAKL